MIIVRTLLLLVIYCSLVNGECEFRKDEQTTKIYEKMKTWAIFEKQLNVSQNGLTYFVGICSTPNNGTGLVAVTEKENNSSYTLGKLNKTNLVQGDNWIQLTYGDGDSYVNVCNNATRSASIMFICGPNKTDLTIRQAHTSTDPQCNYIFQLQVPEMCSPTPTPAPTTTPPPAKESNKLSGGAIFLIVIGSLAGAYLVFGAIYMHIKHGARGIEHIPNLEMWRKCGGLAADGCDYCCRCERHSPRAGYFLDESGPDLRDDDILAP